MGLRCWNSVPRQRLTKWARVCARLFAMLGAMKPEHSSTPELLSSSESESLISSTFTSLSSLLISSSLTSSSLSLSRPINSSLTSCFTSSLDVAVGSFFTSSSSSLPGEWRQEGKGDMGKGEFRGDGLNSSVMESSNFTLPHSSSSSFGLPSSSLTPSSCFTTSLCSRTSLCFSSSLSTPSSLVIVVESMKASSVKHLHASTVPTNQDWPSIRCGSAWSNHSEK
mmetsp:Transcript_20576/g.43789  ORF Transcript_20576/g.43789 Transcript_20576/m.43789 type:complete len:224 (+) Transcript_20576:390-1061(+)